MNTVDTYTITYTIADDFGLAPARRETVNAASLDEAAWEIAVQFRRDRPCRVMRKGWYKPLAIGEGLALAEESDLKRRDQRELITAVRTAMEELRREEHSREIEEYERVQYARRMEAELVAYREDV